MCQSFSNIHVVRFANQRTCNEWKNKERNHFCHFSLLNSFLKGDFTCTSNSIKFSVSVWGFSIPFLSSFFCTTICIRLSVFFWVYLYPLGRACLQMKLECTRGMFSFHWTTDFYNSPWKHMVNLYTTVAWCKLENYKIKVLIHLAREN